MKCAINDIRLPTDIKEIPCCFHYAGFDDYDLVIPKTVEKIGRVAFCSARGIKTISFEDGSVLRSVEDK